MGKSFRLLITSVLLISITTACGQTSSATPQPSNTPQQSATTPPTLTPVPSATSRPTTTPRPTSTPAPTSTPTRTLIPGWKLIKGDGVTIQLPESFVGGKLTGDDFDALVKSVKLLGGDFTQIAENLKNFKSLYVLWAYDSKVGKSGVLANVGVAQVPSISSIKLETVADQMIASFPDSFKIVSREVINDLPYSEALKLTVNATAFGKPLKESLYMLKDKSTIWMIVFATGSDDFESYTPVFEQSVTTFSATP